MSETKTKQFVPNVTAKRDGKEAARMQTQVGNMREQNGQFITDETDQKYTLERRGEETDGSGGLALKKIPSVYFCGCKNGEYTIDHRTSKILIENCENITVIVNGKLLTSTVEVWKCKGVTLQANTRIKTLQCDIMTGMKVQFRSPDDMQAIVWQDVDTVDISFLGEHAKYNLATGFADMLKKHPDSDALIDQFIARVVPELGEGVTAERCVRLKNGHLSTEREAAEWDRRNELAQERFKESFCKEAGITVNREKGVKKIQPNAKCPCGSDKKYKKCCMNKKEITGLHETQKNKTYQPSKDGVVVK